MLSATANFYNPRGAWNRIVDEFVDKDFAAPNFSATRAEVGSVRPESRVRFTRLAAVAAGVLAALTDEYLADIILRGRKALSHFFPRSAAAPAR